MRSVCNVDFKVQTSWGSSCSAENVNEVSLVIYPLDTQKTNLKLEITDVKGLVTVVNVVREANGTIEYVIPSKYYAYMGSFKVRLLSSEGVSMFINFGVMETFKVEDNIICKFRYSTKTFEIAKYVATGGVDLGPVWGAIDNIIATTITTDIFNAEKATIYSLVAEKATIEDLNATNATIKQLNVTKLDVKEFNAEVGRIDDLIVKRATIDDLHAIEATIELMNVHIANIDKAIIDVAYITDITALNAKIDTIDAKMINVEYLDANYAQIDLANIKDGCITTAMIGTGVVDNAQIADGSITEAKIVSLTANKITAGTLDATEIEVINLKASNITVGTINGKQIGNGAIDWDKLNGNVSNTITSASADAKKALEDALNAMSKATGAQSTADGKNTISYQTTAPSVTGRKINDMWFDTDDANRMYYFDGTAWVQKQFGTNAISDVAINNAKIANLDAGKITTGYINANRIQAGSLVISKLDTSTQTTINNANTNASKALSDIVALDKELGVLDGKVTSVDTTIANWCYNNDTTYVDGKNIYTGTVTAVQIATGAIIAGKIGANAVTTANLQADSVNADKISADAILAKHIQAGVITGDKMVVSTITGDKIAVRTINANNIVANAITSAEIKAGSIEGTSIKAGTIEATHIKASTITATQIASNAITADKINANAITSAKIATDAITASHIQAGAITSDKISAKTLTGIKIIGGSIESNTTINVTTDLRVGNNVYIGSYTNRDTKKYVYLNDIFSVASRNGVASFGLVNDTAFAVGTVSVTSGGSLYLKGKDYLRLQCGNDSVYLSTTGVIMNGRNITTKGSIGGWTTTILPNGIKMATRLVTITCGWYTWAGDVRISDTYIQPALPSGFFSSVHYQSFGLRDTNHGFWIDLAGDYSSTMMSRAYLCGAGNSPRATANIYCLVIGE